MAVNRAAFGLEDKPTSDDLAKRLAKQLVAGKSREDLLRLAGMVTRMQAEKDGEVARDGEPTTPDELWDYVVKRYGVRIARVSVCEDHDTPFDYVCAGFFEWYPNVFGIGPRGGGKSYDQALLHDLNSHWKNGCESATFGAVEEQAKRVYAAFKTFIDPAEIKGDAKISETLYKPVGEMNYGSKVEVLGGTVAAVNGPHPQKAHSDEVEIMRADTWRESRNLASAKTTPDGRHIKAQNYGTSTMKWKGGRVWQILESFKRAKQAAIDRYGPEPEKRELVDDLVTKTTTFYVLTWCLFEVAAQVPNCRAVPENDHLPEWEPGMDRDQCRCDCNEILNGSLEAQDENGDPLPRTLESECRGRFYRSRGHRTRAEVIQLFLQNDARTWNAQQLCRETESEGLFIPSFSRNRHGLARFGLDVANGPIFSGTDWGFVDESAITWIQYLDRAVEAIRYDGRTIVLPRGARVAISELTIARKTATELGQLAIMREIKLANVMSISRIQVRRRWADLQGAGDRRDWAKMGLKTARYSTRNFEEHVREWRGLVDADRFFVVVDEDRFSGLGCPVLCEQIEGWREEDGKESRELPQHLCLIAGTSVKLDCGDVPIERVRPGDMVLTREGYRRVVEAGMTDPDAELWELEVEDGRRLVGTAEHPVMTDRGWTPLHAVRYGDYLWSLSSSSVQSGARSSCSTASDTGAIRRPQLGRRRHTSRRAGRAWGAFIRKSGASITDLFQTATRSITLATSEIIRSATFVASPAVSTSGWTSRSVAGSRKGSGRISAEFKASPRSAFDLTMRRSKCGNALRSCGRTLRRLLINAISAPKNSRPWSSAAAAGSARTTASQPGDATLGSMTSSDLANGAASHSRSTDTTKLRAVRSLAPRRLDGRAAVYNLTVAGAPEFFANGLLVHNCSSARYCLYGMHDIFQDAGNQSPEQTEAVRIASATGTAPVAKPYRDPDGTQGELAQAGWRSRF